jgi:imidazoleglycerol-phosphate dehydratase
MKKVVRETKETRVVVHVAPASTGALGARVSIDTGQPFFDHMLTAFGKYAGISLIVEARGDLRHHLMEDVALTIGRAVRAITPESAARYGERTIPMDDALVQAVIDVGGRFYFEGELPNRLYTHVLRSFADALGATLHVRVIRGVDRHHILEAAFKATGLALRQALSDVGGGVFSTKGQVAFELSDEEPGDTLSRPIVASPELADDVEDET